MTGVQTCALPISPGSGRLPDEIFPVEVKSMIIDAAFLGAPPGLELAQSGILRFRTAEAEGLASGTSIVFDRFPHDQVVGPGCQKSPVGSSIFVDDFFAELKTDYRDRKSTRLNSSHIPLSRMPSSA